MNLFFFTQAINALKDLYETTGNGTGSGLDNVDLFTGGMLETTTDGPGELFYRILLDQFLRVRHGDRFWYENTQHRYASWRESRLTFC